LACSSWWLREQHLSIALRHILSFGRYREGITSQESILVTWQIKLHCCVGIIHVMGWPISQDTQYRVFSS
jgi:hypothetical protein